MAAKNAWVFDVTEAEFEAKVVKKSQETPVVVDFWAPWCAPCKSLAPILEAKIAEREGAVLLAKVNTDEEQNLAAQFGISGIPHVVAFRKGKPFLQFTGLLAEAQLVDFFDQLQPTEAEKRIEQAAALEKTKPAEAENLYRLALKANPNQEEVIVGLARVLIDLKKDKEAAELLEQIGSHGDFGPEADKLRAILWLREQTNDLPDEESLRKKAKAEPKNAKALCDLGCVLAANGKTAEALEMLFQAGRFDPKLASSRVREAMVKIFFVIGVRSELADAYRDKLTALLY
jgi:putative thioredoxin